MISFALKQCKTCNQMRPRGEYYFDARASDGLQWQCKLCEKAGLRARKYGISTQEVDAFLAIPNCQACGSTFASDHSLKLDHCHSKGHVRGAICHACNMAMAGSADEAMRRLDCCRQYLIRDLERQNEQS
jgi:hypothetical protein